jgi:hypothetical protein
MEYWNSTAALTGAGRPVDAILQPALPFAAARPGKHTYYGHTTAYNVLDYAAAVLPVTKVDTAVDVFDSSYTPKNDEDRANYEACKCSMNWVLCGLANHLTTIQTYMMVRLSLYRLSEGDSKKKRFYPWWSLCQACWQRLELSSARSQQVDLNISMQNSWGYPT